METEPAADDSATAKTYVDNLAATNLALVWAQNYATEDYVDQAIADVDSMKVVVEVVVITCH